MNSQTSNAVQSNPAATIENQNAPDRVNPNTTPNTNSDTNKKILGGGTPGAPKAGSPGVMPPDTVNGAVKKPRVPTTPAPKAGTSVNTQTAPTQNNPAQPLGQGALGTGRTGGRTDGMDSTPGSGTSTGSPSGTTQIK